MEKVKVPYSVFFTNRRALLAIFITFMASLAGLYYGPVLAPYLVQSVGIPV